MKNILNVFALSIFFISFATTQAQEAVVKISLEKKWETEAVFKTPESVLYDAVSGNVFVANINGSPTGKDGNGFIARLSPDGIILQPEWVTGLDAPKGMAVFEGRLFVTNITEVVEIDIAGARIVRRIPVNGSMFLNDLAVNEQGELFATDTQYGRIYKIQNGKANSWMEDQLISGANGLYYSKGFLFIGGGGNIMKVDVKTNEMVVEVARTGSVDGLYLTADNRFIFSDWKGSVFIAKVNGIPEKILDLTREKTNIADFGVIPEKNLLLLPTFANHRVICYSFK
jgi:DNA-binding beta-propeller fold protein YncE